jgi:hypothetical protein
VQVPIRPRQGPQEIRPAAEGENRPQSVIAVGQRQDRGRENPSRPSFVFPKSLSGVGA